ncbi:hypothetical protein Riv7116_1742 [Rivularia sp. PCC 7116]|nr:hypothetical protein Riv7116_1742 [Rivularia sp. PCC 7116]
MQLHFNFWRESINIVDNWNILVENTDDSFTVATVLWV